MQTRGFYDFETYIDSKVSKAWLISLKINNIYHHFRRIEEFFDFLNSYQENITLWAWNMKKYEAAYLKPFFFLKDSILKYYYEDNIPKNKKNVWTDLASDYGNTTYKIIWYNSKGIKLTFLCGLLSVGGGSIESWGKVFNLEKGETPIVSKEIINLKNLPQKYIDYVDRDVDILECVVEMLLKLISYDNKEYKMTLNGYSNWWWKKNSTIDFTFFFINKIKSYDIWLKLRTAFRGGYNFVNEEYVEKKLEFYGEDHKSAYPTQLVQKDMPWGEPIKCDDTCKHILSISNVNYFNFSLKNHKLPIFTEDSKLITIYKNEGEFISWSATNKEHELIKENYNFDYSELNWKYCFKSRNYLFHEYFEFWFKIKETNIGVVQKFAKIFNNCLWGSEAQNPVKNNKVFIWQNEEPKHESKIAYPSETGGFWVEKILKKNENYEKYFKSWKCKYFPLGVFTTSYQRIDIIKGGELNYERLLMIDTDCIVIKGKKENFIRPHWNTHNFPKWAIKYKLGVFEPIQKTKYIKVIAPKNYLLIDNEDNVVEAVVAGLKKDRKIIGDIKHGEYKKNAVIKDGSTKSRRMRHGGVEITKKDFKIKDSKKSSMFRR